MIRDQLTYGLGRLAAVARQRDWKSGEELGLTPTQGDVLRMLSGRLFGLRLNELAGQLSVRPSTASDAVSALFTKGWVVKEADPDSSRAIRIRLSQEGSMLLGQMPDGHSHVVALLSDAEVESMHAIVIGAIGRLQKSGQIAPQRICVTCKYFLPDARLDKAHSNFCVLIGQALEIADLRVDCAEHEEKHSST